MAMDAEPESTDISELELERDGLRQRVRKLENRIETLYRYRKTPLMMDYEKGK